MRKLLRTATFYKIRIFQLSVTEGDVYFRNVMAYRKSPVAAYRKCQPEDFRCGPNLAGPCLPKEKKCDGYYDCRNRRDEEGCPADSGVSCSLDQFRCANKQRCIDNFLKCNHRNDCGDNSDEENCSEYPLEAQRYLCEFTL
jgi:Low-density lipoprotein receptor domain class A.